MKLHIGGIEPINGWMLMNTQPFADGCCEAIYASRVIEHVQDAALVLEKLIAAIRSSGHLVLGETYHDSYCPSKEFNLAHPIILKRSFFTTATESLTPLYLSENDGTLYLIARKNVHKTD